MPRPDVEHDSDVAGAAGRAELAYRAAVRNQRVVHRLASGRSVRSPRSEHPQAVADPECDGLVDGRPARHAIAESIEGDRGILGEPLSDVGVRPSPAILQRLGKIPVIERDIRLDARLEKPVDQTVVEVDSALIHTAHAIRQDPRPAEREPVRRDAELHEEPDIVRPPVVVVDCDIPRNVLPHVPWGVAERVPDGRALPVLVPGALDLIRARGRSEHEPFREADHSAAPRSRRQARGGAQAQWRRAASHRAAATAPEGSRRRW